LLKKSCFINDDDGGGGGDDDDDDDAEVCMLINLTRRSVCLE
jgi:hypothetical protein